MGGKMKKLALIIMVLGMMVYSNVNAADVSDLENLTLQQESYWKGSNLEGSYNATDSFTTGGASFNNFYDYNADWGLVSWSGFAYSNITDIATSGLYGQYSSIVGSGQNSSSNYAIGYCNAFGSGQPAITFENPQDVTGAYFTNTNYAYYSMLNGDQFAKKFETGDWFKLTVTGKDEAGAETGKVEFLLADGAAIVNTWTFVDLSTLSLSGKMVKTLEFALTSSDSGEWGMNTPAYFAMDTLNGSGDFENLTLNDASFWNGSDLNGSYKATDEFTSGVATYNNYFAYDAEYMYNSWGGFAYSNITDTAAKGFTAQYNAITGSGAKGSDNYVIGYYNSFEPGQSEITFAEAQVISGAYFTNTNYAYYSMMNGDQFAKKFEAGDWFKLTITGKDEAGTETGTVEFLLADGTEIVDVWTWVDLSSLGKVKSIFFSLSSSDAGDFGMNTPSYFALDSINDPEQANINDDDDDDDDWLEGCFIGVSGNSLNF